MTLSSHTLRRALMLSAAASLLLACAPGSGTSALAQGVDRSVWPAVADAGLVDAAVEARITALMARMSLEEKVGQTIQADIASIQPEDLRRYPLGSVLAGGNSGPGGNDRAPREAWLALAQAFHEVSTEARPGHTGIPVIFGVDAVHGHNNVFGATIFPHNIGLGAARDPDLIRRIGEATGRELAATGVDWTFAPTVAVARDDRWGRAYESYSEEPEVVAAYARAVVEGLQGPDGGDDGLQPGRTVSSVKHYLGDGGTQDGRDQGDTRVSEAELVRIHNAGYPPAIAAGALTVMASFSSWNGEKVTGHEGLLTEALKNRMGFDGFVVSDWNAHAQVAGCAPDSCARAFNAGIDMFMAPDTWRGLYDTTLAQARSGEISMARLDDAVRRILRVKFKAGLFDNPAPVDRVGAGDYSVLGSPDHRALAREAVRASLVLLKNDNALLPLQPGARVLVAGDGADDIGKQSGGWTISWQGTDNTNADFPNGQSIWGGIAETVQAGGGQAVLSADGRFSERPDVAIVVFGEDPYAEFQGDRPTLDFAPEGPLAVLRRLKAAGVPVVSVFLSGRPLWVNPEINASDAFVAAWLPGSEGGGVADVLFRAPDGSVAHDFTGKLSFSWPRLANQYRLNASDADYNPLFAFGFGRTYADRTDLGVLSEEAGVAAAAAASETYYAAGRVPEPWAISLRDASGTAPVTAGASPSTALTVRAADASAQESGRLLNWSGTGEASFVVSGAPVDLSRQATGDMAVAIRLRVETAPTGPVILSAGCGTGCRGGVDIASLLGAGPEFRTIQVKLSCLRDAGADLIRTEEPVVLTTSGRLALVVEDIRLVSNTGSAVCPA
jgi:beta-glucosidase